MSSLGVRHIEAAGRKTRHGESIRNTVQFGELKKARVTVDERASGIQMNQPQKSFCAVAIRRSTSAGETGAMSTMSCRAGHFRQSLRCPKCRKRAHSLQDLIAAFFRESHANFQVFVFNGRNLHATESLVRSALFLNQKGPGRQRRRTDASPPNSSC